MSILRVQKKASKYTQIYNSVFNDRRLSYEGVGLLSYLLSKPHNWRVSIKNLIRDKNGRDQVYRIIKELMKFGYIHRMIIREESSGRISRHDYNVFEEPVNDKMQSLPEFSEKCKSTPS